MKNFLLLLKTVVHLKPIQIYGRLFFRLKKVRQIPKYEGRSLLPKRTPIDWCPRKRSFFEDKVVFLNEEGVRPSGDWNPEGKSHLWRYNLNYFEDLLSPAREDHLEMINVWINANPPGTGCAWEPYPLSLRIVNWIKWLSIDKSIPEHLSQSLYAQAFYLSKKLEFHLLGNHLFVNAKALVFIGLFLEDNSFFKRGMEIVNEQISEQVWEDGAHFENSPMYHSLFLEDMLDLVNILKSYEREVPDSWNSVIESMLYFLKRMTHTDGEISHFNDSAIGISPSPEVLFSYAKNLNFKVIDEQEDVLFEKSGYFSSYKNGHAMIVDAGPIGPGYIFGHGHCDNLSFELSGPLGRVFTNSGISQYGKGEVRLIQRQTRAHNSLIIDNKEISEVWGGFRVARQAKPLFSRVEKNDSQVRLLAAHDGYKAPNGSPLHERIFEIDDSGVNISDNLLGKYFNEAEAHFHIAPDWSLSEISKGEFHLLKDGVAHYLLKSTWPKTRIESYSYHRGFGLSAKAKKIITHCEFLAGELSYSFKITYIA